MKSSNKRKYYALAVFLLIFFQNCSDAHLTNGVNSMNNMNSLNFQGIIGQSGTLSQSGGTAGGGGSSTALPTPTSSVLASRIIVADPNGTPSGNGTVASPVDLFTASNLAAAVIKASDSGAVQVLLNGGTYFLPQPLVFTAANSGTQNSPISYAPRLGNCSPNAACPSPWSNSWTTSNTPVFSGSLTLSMSNPLVHSSWVTIPTVSGNTSVMRVVATGALGAQLQSLVQTIKANNNGGAFTVGKVFQDGSPLIRSRYPSSPSLVWNQYQQSGGATAEVWFQAALGMQNMSAYILNGQTEVLFTNIYEEFKGVISSVASVNGQTPMNQSWNTVHFDEAMRQNQPNGSINPVAELLPDAWSNYYESGWLENNKYFVNNTGFWYFDSNEMALYVLPNGSNPDHFDLAFGYNLIEFQGTKSNPVSNLSFNGIQFQMTNWRYQTGTGNTNPAFYSFGQAAYGLEGAIDGNDTSKISINNNLFQFTGASGIALNGCRTNLADGACSGNLGITVENNLFSNIGGSAILLDDRTNNTTLTTIAGNQITNVGQTFFDAPGVVVLQGNNVEIQNNTVQNAPYSGFHLGWRCNYFTNTHIELEGNTVNQVLTMLADGGDFYTQGARGEVKNNYFSKAGQYRAAGFSALPSPANDIYLDGFQTFWAIHGNNITQVNGANAGVVITSSVTSSIYQISGAATLNQPWITRQPSQYTEAQCPSSSLDGSTLGYQQPNWWSFPTAQTLN